MRESASTLVLLFLCLLSFGPARFAVGADAQKSEPVTIMFQGTVAEHLKFRPVDNARVELRDLAKNEIVADTETGSDGKFFLAGVALAPGKYAVRATLTNFKAEQQEITIDQNTKEIKPIPFILTCEKVGGPPMRHSVIRVFYATDRQEGSSTLKWTNRLSYQNVRAKDGKLSLGFSDVSVPEIHQPTGIEQPSVWKLEFRPNPDKHLIIQSVQPEPNDAFFKEVSAQVSASEGKDAFVFVHGYGLSFESAVQRTAQLAYDLKFRGAPILYSWASKASWLGYVEDEERVRLTTDDLRNFLREVAQRSGAKTVHLIAHSMGNRALLEALRQLEAEAAPKPAASPFRNIVLAAPDVDRDAFIQLEKQIKQPDQRVTLYVSSADQVLMISHKLFHTEARAGEAGANIIVLPGMDTIDVTRTSIDMLGHSYYGNNRPVVRDLSHIFGNQGVPRPGLAQTSRGSLVYWLLTPNN